MSPAVRWRVIGLYLTSLNIDKLLKRSVSPPNLAGNTKIRKRLKVWVKWLKWSCRVWWNCLGVAWRRFLSWQSSLCPDPRRWRRGKVGSFPSDPKRIESRWEKSRKRVFDGIESPLLQRRSTGTSPKSIAAEGEEEVEWRRRKAIMESQRFAFEQGFRRSTYIALNEWRVG